MQKTYEKMNAPAFPKGGEMANWLYSLGTSAVVSGIFRDEFEVAWLRECWAKSFEELGDSGMEGAEDHL